MRSVGAHFKGRAEFDNSMMAACAFDTTAQFIPVRHYCDRRVGWRSSGSSSGSCSGYMRVADIGGGGGGRGGRSWGPCSEQT
jgi:hypothetical protein